MNIHRRVSIDSIPFPHFFCFFFFPPFMNNQIGLLASNPFLHAAALEPRWDTVVIRKKMASSEK